jgi:polyferredoxin
MWETLQLAALLLVLLGIGYLADATFQHGLKVLLHSFLEEVRDFVQLKTNERAHNLLFGLLMFVALVLLVAAVAVSSLFSKAMPQYHPLSISGDLIILSGVFLLFLFFVISTAYCRKIRR